MQPLPGQPVPSIPPKKKMPSCKKRLFFTGIVLLFLIYGWLIYSTVAPPLPQYDRPPKIYANQCRQDLKFTLLHALRKAKHSIHLVMYSLTDESFINLLQKRALSLDEVTVYYDAKTYSPLPKIENNRIEKVKCNGLMHQKILVIDDQMVFISSANLTPSSLRMDDNLMVGFQSAKIASFLREKSPFYSGMIKDTVGLQEVELWLLPDHGNRALDKIVALIREAKEKLSLSMFTLTHPLLISELIKAHEKGIKVTVKLDFHSALGTSKKAVEKLKKASVPVIYHSGHEQFHHKYLIIDEDTFLIGSANWTKAAFSKNKDCFVILSSLTKSQKRILRKLEKIIEIEKRNTP